MSTSNFRTAWSVCFDRSSRWYIFIGYAVCVVGGILALLLAQHGQNDGFGAAMFFGAGAAWMWVNVTGRGLWLLLDAGALRMPSIANAMASVLSMLFIITVVMPAVLLGLDAGDFALFSALLASAAFAGALWTLLPRAMAILLYPAVFIFHVEKLIPRPQLHEPFDAAFLWMLALLLALLVFWRLQRVLGQERVPALMGLPMQSQSDPRIVDAGAQQTDVITGLPSTASVDGLGPHRPVPAMGACLGSPFALPDWRQRGKGLGVWLTWMLILALVLVLFTHTLKEERAWFPWIGLIAGSAVLATVIQTQLRSLYQRQDGAITELALLPGWGDARRTRRILLTVVFQPLVVGTLSVSLLMAALAFGQGLLGKTVIETIIVCVALGVASASGASCLRALAGLPRALNWTVALYWIALAFTLIALIPMVYGNEFPDGILWPIVIAWVVVIALMASLALHAYLRFTERPHPFLTT